MDMAPDIYLYPKISMVDGHLCFYFLVAVGLCVFLLRQSVEDVFEVVLVRSHFAQKFAILRLKSIDTKTFLSVCLSSDLSLSLSLSLSHTHTLTHTHTHTHTHTSYTQEKERGTSKKGTSGKRQRYRKIDEIKLREREKNGEKIRARLKIGRKIKERSKNRKKDW